jgi:ABC-2 type transport system permease protein
MRPEMIVAVKEFKDYLTSKRFLLIFAVLLLMSIAAIIAGVASYNSQLAMYDQLLSTPPTSPLSGFIFKPQMPSILLIFQSFSVSFMTVGWLLAIAIGFDLISKEKESGSLKLLLARPVFRDSIINGKIIGSTAILVVALAATFLVAIALLLFKGIVPAWSDLATLLMFLVTLVLFSMAFLAVAIAASALSKNSTMAILIAIGFVVFSLLMPSFSSSVGSVILGSAPQTMLPSTAVNSNSGNTQVAQVSQVISGPGGAVFVNNGTGGAQIQMQVNPAYTSYEMKMNILTGLMDLTSPTSDLSGISSDLLSSSNTAVSTDVNGHVQVASRAQSSNSSIGDALLGSIPMLLIMILGFVIAYLKFMRMDVR